MHIQRQMQHTIAQPTTTYKWIAGENVKEYSGSGDKWRQYTNTEEFAESMNKIVENEDISNSARASQVEQFILDQAVKVGVIKKVEVTSAKNPNKWNK